MRNIVQPVRNQIRRLLRFIHHELWEVEPATLPQPRRLFVRFLRTAHLVIRGIKHDNIPQHASALTLGALISIVPVIAVAFSVIRGLGWGAEDVEIMIADRMADMPAEFQEFVMQMLDQYAQVNVAAMGGIFLVVVLFIVIKMLAGIEGAFNRVWYISDSRNILRKISNYISVLVIVPILVVAASAASTVVGAFFSEQLESVAWVWRSLLRIGPLLAVWLAFSFLYMFVPNTQVKIGPGLISGLVGAVMWLAWQSFYIQFQMGVGKYNAIYGTFASVPIFLGWLYVSWVIVLLGAEVAFSIQNADTYRMERSALNASVRSKLLVAIGIMREAGRAMTGSGHLFVADEYAREQRVSIRLVIEVVRLFERAGLMAALAERPGCYALMKSPELLTVKDVVDTVLRDGADPEQMGLDHLDESIRKVLDDINAGLEGGLEQMTVKALAGSA